MDQKTYTLSLQDKTLRLSFSNLTEQANGSVLAQMGDTVVLSTAVMSKHTSNANYFPLNVEYRERYDAAGIIGGGSYRKREGRPSDEAILKGRLIDRSLRPLFNQHIRRDIQVVNNVLSYDQDNAPEILALIASATALLVSDIPFHTPLGGVHIASKDGRLTVFPSKQEEDDASAVFTLAGIENRINMIEAECKEVSNETALNVITEAQQYIHAIINLQKQIQQEIGKEKQEIELDEAPEEVREMVNEHTLAKIQEVVFTPDRHQRNQSIEEIESEVEELLTAKYGEDNPSYVSQGVAYIDELVNQVVHTAALEQDKRVDGRGFDEVRPLSAHTSILPRTHGSGVFMRGLTHILSTVTLAIVGNEEMHDDMEGRSEKSFMHHYNFPPYSVGETGMFRGPGRREVGHGALAEKALRPLIPNQDDFPYVIRVVSDVLSSNGSSSMGSVCGSSLALFDAGVPLKKHIAGIAMGLITNEDQSSFKVLTDIQGPEDHHGDMDLKVAGTREGITALQMDVKLSGVSLDILQSAFADAEKARFHILSLMEQHIPQPRESLSPHVPIVQIIRINPDKIGAVIGSGGSTIKELQSTTNTEITIKEDGLVVVGGRTTEDVSKTISSIQKMTHMVEVGQFFHAKVIKVVDFGAFVEILPQTEALVHISELQDGFVSDVSKILSVGDTKIVRITGIDEHGKVSASLKNIPDNVTAFNFLI